MEIFIKVIGQTYDISFLVYSLLGIMLSMFILIVFLVIKVYKLSKKYFCMEYEMGLPFLFRMKGTFQKDETIMMLTNEIESLKGKQQNVSIGLAVLLVAVIVSVRTSKSVKTRTGIRFRNEEDQL